MSSISVIIYKTSNNYIGKKVAMRSAYEQRLRFQQKTM